FTFKGLVAFYDPPKKNIVSVLQTFYNAGIKVKVVTGDYTATTMAIASQVGLMDCKNSVTGDELLQLNEREVEQKIKNTNIFSRMFPDAKLRLINALKKQGEIVAMIGDGVNDGPALKAAHIGIAMGSKGSEIAKQAASMVLVDDDLSKMALAVAMGRRIYSNLKKAIQYIISIHIPIVLTVFVPLALGWKFPNIFSPVHIIFLELIMGPTCSIIYENEPAEKNIMLQPPRPFSHTFFSARELITSILQGIAITAGALFVYQYAVHSAYNEPATRAMVFTALIVANITLTMVNRSFYYSVFTTMRYKNNLVWLIIGVTVVMLAMLIYVRPLAVFFGFGTLGMQPLLVSISAGFISAMWFEAVKLVKRRSWPVKI
ncbi:MAG: cation-translocating P-type ATPase, partial [Mucilaginibacter sp.]